MTDKPDKKPKDEQTIPAVEEPDFEAQSDADSGGGGTGKPKDPGQ